MPNAAFVVLCALCACGSAEHPRRVQAHADSRWFCPALYRDDLATASDAAAAWLARTGAVPTSERRASERLRDWLEALPCVARVIPVDCSQRLEIGLQRWMYRRDGVAAYVRGDGRVHVVDRTFIPAECLKVVF